ncbi:F-box domain protein [Aspergillus vadensis CBS 113365]|uniref:F-box domain protein n=1 Tax=Aspergillus vadensis (strain CBS 113365 / IMI 142717 / IBT 24658) TaxID=1448311 RepID=A0A319B783_ASPVC|nr:F-box domain protein [Aspergillus vadensis CBS 113365]PYH66200.1 F-box domain protein [Aspergillus vadensis CBS 113365]
MDVLDLPKRNSPISQPTAVAMGTTSPHPEEKASDAPYMVDDDFAGDDEDGDDDSISPISERAPPWSGTRWARFFPELSSHFSLASPTNSTYPPLPQFHTKGPPHIDGPSQQPERRSKGPSSLSSEDVADNRSSSYTSRSSLTSQGSEATSPVHKLVDSLHITSPTRAGVFDESKYAHQIPPPFPSRSSIAQSKDKPLPQEPPIELTPLSIRHKTPQMHDGRPGYVGRLDPPPRSKKHASHHHPTLSQACNDLERTLAGLGEQQQTPAQLSPRSPLQILDGPLQISRGNMDMVATRPAPRPPASVHNNRQIHKVKSREDAKQTKKSLKNKPSFSFSVPAFGRKLSRVHQRSTSNTSSKSEPESYRASILHQPAVAELGDGEIAELQGSSVIGFRERPLSAGGEKELRMRLPRLQTKEMGESSRKRDNIHGTHEDPEQLRRPHERARGASVGDKYFVSYSKLDGIPATRQHQQTSQTSAMVYELEGGSPQPPAELQGDTTTAIDVPVRVSVSVSVGAMPDTLPDRVILTVLEHITTLDDLFNVAVARRDFYRVFKKHELKLMRIAVFAMSAPAWELREMSPPWDTEWQFVLDPDAPVPEYTPSRYLKRYAEDIYTLAHLKSLILARCGTFLRPETIRGLSGTDDVRAAEVDDAFWRVWTFCRLFGSGKGREGDIAGQLDWLKGGKVARNRRVSEFTSIADPYDANSVLFEPPAGFGDGNTGGLSKEQLLDMTEIWTCLGVLLQPMHGKCTEARATGVFDGHNVEANDSAKEEAVLEEWTYYILTLGLSAVLVLGSIHSHDNTTAVFQRAHSMGLTNWEASDTGASRSSFLREAVSKACQPRGSSTSQVSMRSPGFGSQPSGSHDVSQTSNVPGERESSPDFHRRRQAAYSAQLRNQRQQQPSPPNPVLAEERPISHYATIMSRLEGLPPAPQPPMSVSRIEIPPTTHSYVTNVSYVQPLQPVTPVYYPPQVRDPVDHAIDIMVRELGFAEEDAKWALKITDSGEGINMNAAISLLTRERRTHEQSSRGFSLRKRKSFLSSVINSPESRHSGWKWA